MSAGGDIAPGFGDSVHDAQAVFRAVLNAMSRPGTVQDLEPAFDPPAPLLPAAAAICLSLLDFETPVWIDGAGADIDAAAAYLAFHTGAPRVAEPDRGAFALIPDGAMLPRLDSFFRGTDEEPEKSATLIVQVADLAAAGKGQGGWRLSGPGIDGAVGLRIDGLRDGVAAELADNRDQFPCGVDVILCAGSRIAALPRTTRVEA
jgi:alpha-D-ribose 1-methylphosphonate 5-triphosphate synthase subunit PhnH